MNRPNPTPPARIKPRQILLSKRANIFYLEHVRVLQKDDRVVFLTDTGEELERYFNIPERNTALMLLGKGSSITDAAARRLAESNVLIGFCGNGGTPLFNLAEMVFLSPQSEYRPTEYMQGWVQRWFHEPTRLAMAKDLLQARINACIQHWPSYRVTPQTLLTLPSHAITRFQTAMAQAQDTTTLLLAEAQWAKTLYAQLASAYKLQDFTRQEGQGSHASPEDRVNSLIDHGNYLAYGLAAVALNGLGISYSFPLLHGKTRRGALVFDVADIIKDALVLPLAFQYGTGQGQTADFRAALIEHLHHVEALDKLFDIVKTLSQKNLEEEGVTEKPL